MERIRQMKETEISIEAARFELIKLARVEMDYLDESRKVRGLALPNDTVSALLKGLWALRFTAQHDGRRAMNVARRAGRSGRN